MLNGLYSAAAGMLAQQRRLDSVSNDIANANTPGYKKVRMSFKDLAYTPTARGGAQGTQTGSGAAATMAGRSFAQGAMQTTGRNLDVAIQGEGFIQVRQPNGQLALTRNGALQTDANGDLTTSDGLRLSPPIKIPRGVSPDDVSIAADGTVSAGNRRVGQIELRTVASTAGLQALGENLYGVTAASGPTRAADGQIATGALEASNTDLSDAMVDMMQAQRSFQLASQALQTQDQVWETANGIRR